MSEQDPNADYPSPFDSFPAGPLPSHVAHEGRLNGYDVEDDLSRNYRFTETVFMLVVGQLPDEETAAAFELALYLLTDVSVGDAAVHAARVVRHVHSRDGSPAAVVGTAGIALNELARYEIERHREWIEWLDGDRVAGAPDVALESSADAAARTQRMLDRLRPSHPLSEHSGLGLTSIAAAIGTLHGVGIRRAEQLATCFVFARLPVAIAEAFAVEDARLWKYPLNLPYWVYEPEGEA